MEPQAKRRRIDHGVASPDDTPPPNGVPLSRLQPQSTSSEFAGTGISSNGNFSVGRDLYLATGNTASATSATATKRAELLELLRFEQIDSRQLSIKRAHAKTCRWFLRNPMYKQWETRATSQDEGESFLWIKGKPGAGKSTLMKFLHEEVRSRLRKQNHPHNLISFFFNARGSDLEKSTIGMYRSLLLQLLEYHPELQFVLDQARPGFQNNMDLLKDIFEQATKDSTTVCLIDALDECEVAEIQKMVGWFDDIIEAGSQLSICFASRHYPFVNIRTGLSLILEDQDEHEDDISSYLSMKLNIGHSKLAEQIRREIRQKASGVFMWVVLVVEILNTEYGKGKIHKLHERLKQIPGDLHQLFHSILVRDDEDQDELLLCIQWVLFSRDPLTLKQLYLAINSGSTVQNLVECHSKQITEDDMQRFVMNSSKGLTEATKSKKKPTIQFIHESVRDFLLKGDGMSRVFPKLATNIWGLSQEALRKCCQSYIQMDHKFGQKEPSRDSVTEQFPFLEYATQGVIFHADQAEVNGVSQGEFVKSFPHSAWVKCYNIFQEHKRRRYTANVSMLYILAQAGATALIQGLPHVQSCFEAEEEHYGLPIVAAAASKNYDCVQEMLRIQAKRFPGFSFAEFLTHLPPNLKDSHTPAKYRTRNYNTRTNEPTFVQIVRLGGELASLFYLATEGCDADSEARVRFSTLRMAVEYKYIHLLGELHRRGADVLAAASNGDTLLHYAAYEGDPVVLRQLLDYGVDSSVARKDGSSPLIVLFRDCGTAKDGFLDCAKLLINHGAHVSGADREGYTPLHRALSRHGPESIKLLLNHGADVAPANSRGKTPLHIWSIKSSPTEESIDIGRQLINRGADVTAVDRYGQTPLHCSRTPETSQLLLDYNASISARDSDGKTPLHLAVSESRNLGKCQVLLRGGADVAAVDEKGRTPLHCSRTPETAKLLLDYNACVSARDSDGNTPLHLAVLYLRLNICQVLVRGGADVAAVNKRGRTPLHCSYISGISQLLLEHNAYVSAVDHDGDTPLHDAAGQRASDMCQLLLRYGANPASLNHAGQTPLDKAKMESKDSRLYGNVAEISRILEGIPEIEGDEVS